MTALHAGIPGEFFRLRVSGWIISLCLHGGIIFLTGIVVAKIGLAPPSSLFHWDVTVVSSPNSSPIRPAVSVPTVVAPKVTKPTLRSTPSITASTKRSLAPLQSGPSSATATASVLTQHGHEHIPALPPREQQELASELRVQDRATMMPTETHTESQSVQPTPAPLEAQDSPASEPLPPSAHAPVTPQAIIAPPQVASLPPSIATTPVTRKPDYGWLADSLLHRVETLKQYPALARLDHLEGRVIVRIVIEEDGRIASVALAKSSGHDVLDQAALETLRQASPITLSRPLEKSPVTIQIPLSYRLGR